MYNENFHQVYIYIFIYIYEQIRGKNNCIMLFANLLALWRQTHRFCILQMQTTAHAVQVTVVLQWQRKRKRKDKFFKAWTCPGMVKVFITSEYLDYFTSLLFKLSLLLCLGHLSNVFQVTANELISQDFSSAPVAHDFYHLHQSNQTCQHFLDYFILVEKQGKLGNYLFSFCFLSCRKSYVPST